MSSNVPTLGTPVPKVRAELTALVHHFDRDAAGNGRLIRQLLQQDGQSFLGAATEILRNGSDTRGAQFLISLLAESDLFLPALCQLALTLKQALSLARAAIQAGVMADVVLAKYLAERAESIGDAECPPEIQRMMEILIQISDGARIFPFLIKLAKHANTHLQSKAVLMIGLMNRNVKWVQKRLTEPDPRVRANAVESLWGIDTDEVRQLLRSTARDTDNRAAGNAVIGLYRLGDCSAIPELVRMAEHESRRFRTTAVWIMGETRDPRFTKTLARMVGEPNAEIRTRAFAALSKIRAATAEARQAGELRVVGRFHPNRRAGWSELHVDISRKNGSEQISILPTQLILAEDGQEVVTYTVEERPAPPAMAITLIIPRSGDPASNPLQKGALKALAWKRPVDFWAVALYIPTAAPELHIKFAGQKIDIAEPESSSESISPPFTGNPEVSRQALQRFPPKTDCSNLWTTIRRSVNQQGPPRERGHLLVYSQSESGTSADYAELVTAALASRTSIHVISLRPNLTLEGLAQKTYGTFHQVASEDEAALQFEQLCLVLLARYTVRYQSVCPEAKELQIVVLAPSGYGEETSLIPLNATRPR